MMVFEIEPIRKKSSGVTGTSVTRSATPRATRISVPSGSSTATLTPGMIGTPLERQSSTTASTIVAQSGWGTVEVVVAGGAAVVVGGTLVAGAAVVVGGALVAGAAVVVGAAVVEPDTTVVVGVTGLVVVGAALVAVGAAGLVVLVGAVLEAPPEQAETHMARTAKETAVRLMVGVSHECWSDQHWRPLSSTWLVELGGIDSQKSIRGVHLDRTGPWNQGFASDTYACTRLVVCHL